MEHASHHLQGLDHRLNLFKVIAFYGFRAAIFLSHFVVVSIEDTTLETCDEVTSEGEGSGGGEADTKSD